MTWGGGVVNGRFLSISPRGPERVVAIGSTVKERPPRDGNARFSAGSAGEDLSKHAVDQTRDRRALIEARLRPPAKNYRSWPRPIPRIPALRLSAPSVRFIALAIFATGVRAFECALSSLTSSFDQGLRCAVVFFVGTNSLPDTLARRGER
jgi:hypothetical protein